MDLHADKTMAQREPRRLPRLADWSFGWNLCRWSHGLCRYDRRRNELTALRTAREPDPALSLNTIRHEIAHVGPRASFSNHCRSAMCADGPRRTREVASGADDDDGLDSIPPFRPRHGCSIMPTMIHRLRWPLAVALFAFNLAPAAWALDCNRAATQADLNQCAAQRLDQENKAINRVYRDYMAQLSPKQQARLRDVQRAWITYKDRACEFDVSGVEGGSVHSMVLADCLATRTAERRRELEALRRCQEGDLSCPAH